MVKKQTELFTLADHISDNNFLVKQWSNIFVTSGNTYSFTHDTEDNLMHRLQIWKWQLK